ncbi:MAG: cytochrome c biogenesis CcdA family protein [Proteobacteria bacterium]|nr:cytochrome c biogenesis CcdA family protein [Pseudomonadota bacterium]
MQTLVLAYLAGALTTLNPCVLPMIPFVLATALREGKWGPLALMAGMSVTFTLLGTLIASIGPAIGLSQENIRLGGAIIMIAIGLAMLIPQGQAAFATGFGPLADRASGALDRLSLSGNAGQFVTGLLLGAIWSPCAGPSLFAAIGLAAQTGTVLQAAIAMAFFSFGAASVMLALAYGTREALGRRKAALMAFASSGQGKLVFAALFIAMGVAILAGWDKAAEAALVRAMPDWLVDFTTRI